MRLTSTQAFVLALLFTGAGVVALLSGRLEAALGLLLVAFVLLARGVDADE